MEEKQQKSINDILPLKLIQRILLRIPVKYLIRLKCVSKLWHSLISNPDFAESHLHLSLAPSYAFLYKKDSKESYLVHLEELFNGDNYEVKEVSFPFNQVVPPEFRFMGSCRGFVLLSQLNHFVVWNPLTGFGKGLIYYPSIDFLHGIKRMDFDFPGDASLYGFGYDASRDDYLVLVAWFNGDCQHLDCLNLRTSSWINLDSALPKPLGLKEWRPRGLFLNGSIHWLSSSLEEHYSEGLLIFDLKERSFSKMSLPERLIIHGPITFVILGGCLALYSKDHVEGKTCIWVMKEYNVQSSWTLYVIPCLEYEPLCLSNGSDIIGVNPIPVSSSLKFVKYNIREERLQHFTCPSGIRDYHLDYNYDYTYDYENCSVYPESLLLFPGHCKCWLFFTSSYYRCKRW